MISPIEVAPGSAPDQVKAIRVPQGGRKQVVFRLTNNEGQPMDLSQEVENPPAKPADFSPQRQAVGANCSIRLRARAGDPLRGPVVFDIEGEILDQTKNKGYVQFTLDTTDTKHAGAFEATIGRIVSDLYLSDTWECLVVVEPNAFAAYGSNGPITLPEVRLALLDLDNLTDGAPFSNLLDDVEFTDTEIIFAIRRVVDMWNETPPPVCYYSPTNFPYRYWWLEGTCAHLLLMGAARYRRNRLAYQAGGISIDDQSKANEYEQNGQQRMAAFREWMQTEKYRINMSYCWSSGI